MKKRLNSKHLIILLLFICFPFLGGTKSITSSCLGLDKVLSSSTDLRISSVDLNFFINQDCTYFCSFQGYFLGNNQEENGSLSGSFIVPDTTVTNFSLYIEENLLDLERREENESIIFLFSINQSIPQYLKSRMRGSFYGNFQWTDSNICSYSLGIDWGTIVGEQTTIIWMRPWEFNIIEYPINHPILSTPGEYRKFQWSETMVQGFAAEFILQSTEISIEEILDITPPSPWNVTAGENFEITVKNNAIFNVSVFVIAPSWITPRLKKIDLKPNEMIEVTFQISSQVSRGMNDTFEFKIEYFQTLNKPVLVTRSQPSNNLFFILSLSSFIFVGAISGYYYREKLQVALQQMQPSFEKLRSNFFPSKNSSNSLLHNTGFTSELEMWDSVKNRWEPILPENEFKVLETLFFNGTINQQTIAEELGMSQMTVSRVVSRLESKQLLTKKRSGMSNMIILNINKL